MNALCLYYHLKYPSLEGFSLTQLAVWCPWISWRRYMKEQRKWSNKMD